MATGPVTVITSMPITQRLPAGSFLDITDTATYLGVARTTVHRWIQNDELEAVRDEPAGGSTGWRWLIPTEAIMAKKRERR